MTLARLIHTTGIIIWVLVAATFILPALAYAQNNQGDHQIAALQAQITALQNQVNALQSQLNAVLSSNVYALNPYVSVDLKKENGVNPPNIVFSGANIHIVNGSGNTSFNSGLGNLVIGYDEDPVVAGPSPLSPGDRGGSHNLVIGRYHRFRGLWARGAGCAMRSNEKKGSLLRLPPTIPSRSD